MNKVRQEDINKALVDYCDRLEKESNEQSKKLDMLLDILEAMAEKISQ